MSIRSDRDARSVRSSTSRNGKQCTHEPPASQTRQQCAPYHGFPRHVHSKIKSEASVYLACRGGGIEPKSATIADVTTTRVVYKAGSDGMWIVSGAAMTGEGRNQSEARKHGEERVILHAEGSTGARKVVGMTRLETRRAMHRPAFEPKSWLYVTRRRPVERGHLVCAGKRVTRATGRR